MKTDGRLARRTLKGTPGEAIHAVLCGCGHNIRMTLAHLRALVTVILAALTAAIANSSADARPNHTSTATAAQCSATIKSSPGSREPRGQSQSRSRSRHRR